MAFIFHAVFLACSIIGLGVTLFGVFRRRSQTLPSASAGPLILKTSWRDRTKN